MGNTFKVGTYNILHSYNPSKIAGNLKMMADDGVIAFALQEVVKEKHKPFVGDVILKRLGPKWKVIESLREVIPGRSWGTAIIYDSSRLRLVSSKNILPKKIERLTSFQVLLSVLIMGGKGVVYPRSFISAKFRLGNNNLYLSSIHPDFFANTKYRIAQLKYFLSEKLESNSVDPEIICGDFNNLDYLKTKKEVSQIQKALGEDFVDATKAIPWSVNIFNVSENFATPLFIWFKKLIPFKVRRKIDYIWVKNVEVLSAKAYELLGSDHLPLVAYLRLNDSNE